MKKLASLLLILMLIALCAPALAENTNGLGDTIARSAELAAFLDGSGNIYISGLGQPVNATKAASLVSIDPYRILFFAQGNRNRLIALKLDGFAESVVTDDAYAACLDEENVYYISQSNRKQLVRYNLDDSTSVVVYSAAEALDRVYESGIGVIVSLVDGAGTYINDSVSGQFIPYVGDAARETAEGDGFEVYLTDANNLFARMDGALAPAQVDSNVRAWAIVGHNVYYLTGPDGAMSLKQYNVDVNLWSTVMALPADIQPQLTASQNSLFLLASNNMVYSVDIAGQRLVNFITLPTPQSYALGGTRSISGYRIEAVSGQLNVYGLVEDTSALPTFTFVDFSATVAQDQSDIMLLNAYTIDAESTVWNLLQPAVQYSSLRRGSRGDAVAQIQRPLLDKGYYSYVVDGIFGWRTERAVEMLQDALGLRVTGIADADLQSRILSGSFPAYDPYGTLRFGDRGLRVRDMQQRLRDLGYLADDADSVFGERTQAAVELFQRENGLTVDGIAGPETLRRLFASTARVCSSYIDLRLGDTGYRVRELNRRLKELFYLDGSVGSTYTYGTAEAVRLFQREIGMAQNGEATVAVQRELFSRDAPEYSGFITLRRGDDNRRVLEMQRRLMQLGYYSNGLDGYFGKGTYQAVRAFQRQAGLRVTGVADPLTLRRLFAPDAPAYQPPKKPTTPEIDFYGDSFEMDDSGVYLVPEDTESLTFFWTAKGVANYDIRLSGNGETITSMSGTTDEMVSVSTARLLKDVVYKLTVVAHPEDTTRYEDANASLKFKIVTQPSVVESVSISPVKDTYTREDGVYIIPGDEIAFRWTAYGDVERYSYIVYAQSDPENPIGQGEAANLTEWSVSASQLAENETYTLTVHAFPKNGTLENAVSDTVSFRRAVEPLPTIEPTPEPTEEPSPAPTEEPAPSEAEGQELPGIEGEQPVASDAPAGEQPAASDAPADEQPVASEAPIDEQPVPSDAPADEQPVASEAPAGEQPAASVAPAGEQPVASVAPSDDPASPSFSGQTLPGMEGFVGDPAQEIIGTPYIQVSPVIGETAMEIAQPDGSLALESIAIVGEGDVALSWSTEGDVIEYQVTITDSNGNTPVNERLANPGASVNSQKLVPGEVYALTATAFFRSGDATSSAFYFMRPAAEEEPSGESYYEEPGYEEPIVEEPGYEEPVAEEPGYESVPLGAPMVQVYPSMGETDVEVAQPDGSVALERVVVVGEGNLELSWAAEGDVAEYQVTITDSYGNVMIDNRLTNTSAVISSQNLTPNMIYAMNATAYSNSGESTSAVLRFMLPGEESAQEAAPEEDYYEAPYAGEPAYDDSGYEEPAYEEPWYEEPGYEEPGYEEPGYEEPGYEEPGYEEPEDGGWGSSIDASSGADAISALQATLCAQGWLSAGEYTDGVLDEATVQAVIAFQQYCMDNGVSLTPIDPSNPIIGSDTLDLLYTSISTQ